MAFFWEKIFQMLNVKKSIKYQRGQHVRFSPSTLQREVARQKKLTASSNPFYNFLFEYAVAAKTNNLAYPGRNIMNAEEAVRLTCEAQRIWKQMTEDQRKPYKTIAMEQLRLRKRRSSVLGNKSTTSMRRKRSQSRLNLTRRKSSKNLDVHKSASCTSLSIPNRKEMHDNAEVMNIESEFNAKYVDAPRRRPRRLKQIVETCEDEPVASTSLNIPSRLAIKNDAEDVDIEGELNEKYVDAPRRRSRRSEEIVEMCEEEPVASTSLSIPSRMGINNVEDVDIESEFNAKYVDAPRRRARRNVRKSNR